MRAPIIVLIFMVSVVDAAQPAPPPVKCLELPPEVREAWHLKPTDCPHAIPVVSACDVTPPDIAKRLGLDLHRCPKGSVANP